MSPPGKVNKIGTKWSDNIYHPKFNEPKLLFLGRSKLPQKFKKIKKHILSPNLY